MHGIMLLLRICMCVHPPRLYFYKAILNIASFVWKDKNSGTMDATFRLASDSEALYRAIIIWWFVLSPAAAATGNILL